ncbi:MAG TPA: SDR family NAD(P)-dependent oxidoreductase [Polyangia bacterium]|nr:SDR family NAD(P)-dependent oxidoreductase [Polyangia bacterium]
MEKNVLITGSASGLGYEAVRVFAERGYHVFAGVRAAEDANKVARIHRGVTPVVLDVADPAQVKAAAEQVDRACGPAGLAVLINAAGSNLYGPIEHTTRTEAAALFDVLAFGPFELSNLVLPALKRFSNRKEGRAKVLNVISWAAIDASPFVGFYAAAKAALLRLTQAQYFELARFGVDAVAVVPGMMKTSFLTKVEGQIGEAMARLSPAGRHDYGGGLAHMASMSRQASRNPLAASPEKVARRLLAIAEKRRSRYQYNVGLDTALVRFMNFVLPFWLLKAAKNALFGLDDRHDRPPSPVTAAP